MKQAPCSLSTCRYIVERIVSEKCETVCFCGRAELTHISCRLCKPFQLQGAEAVCIESCRDNGRVLITLHLYLQDAKGRRGEGRTSIAVDAEPVSDTCGLKVYRCAQVRVERACFCPPSAWELSIRVCLKTFLCRLEIIGSGKKPEHEQRFPPLYPQAVPYGAE